MCVCVHVLGKFNDLLLVGSRSGWLRVQIPPSPTEFVVVMTYLTLYPRRACAEINLVATRQDIEKWRFCIMTIDSVISCKLAEFTG